MSSFEETFKQQEAVLDAIFLNAVSDSDDWMAVGILPAVMGLIEGYSHHKYGGRAQKLCAFKSCVYLRKIQHTKRPQCSMPETLGFLFEKLIVPALEETPHCKVLSSNLVYQVGALNEAEDKAVRNKVRVSLENRFSAPSRAVQLLHKVVKKGARPNRTIISLLLHTVARYGSTEDYFRLMNVEHL